MRLILIFTLLFLLKQQGIAQYKFDYNWVLGQFCEEYFGDTLLMNTTPINNFVLGFNEDSVTLTHRLWGVDMTIGNFSMSSNNGVLQFYSNGCNITNVTNETMENGEQLNYGDGEFWNNYCLGESGNYPSMKSMLGLPYPGKKDTFVLLHLGINLLDPDPLGLTVHHNVLYYSLIDMKANDGLGKVYEKNIVLKTGSFSANLAAVKQADKDAWWIVLAHTTGATYSTFELTDQGMSNAIMNQIIGTEFINAGGGLLKFSSQGDIFARIGTAPYDDSIMVASYDRTTGLLGDILVWRLPIDLPVNIFSCEFSPSGQFLYLGLGFYVYQYDLWSDNIPGSETLIAEWDGLLNYGAWPEAMNNLSLAPDCRIYMQGWWSTRRLGVILYPDRKGAACMLQQHIIDTKCSLGNSLIAYPNYRLDTEYPTCDSTIALTIMDPVSSVSTHLAQDGLATWPNPFSTQLNLDWATPLNDLEVNLHDALGRLMQQHKLPDASERFQIDGTTLLDGVYTLVLKQNGMPLVSRAIAVQH